MSREQREANKEKKAQSDNRLKCSFCGKSQDQVVKLIAGPGVYICNECVGLCNEILEEEFIEQPSVASKLKQPNTSDSVSFYSANLNRLQWMTKDNWRGEPKPEDNPERTKLVKEAVKTLEGLVEHDLNNAVTFGAEPVLRALLCLKEQAIGNDSEELLEPLRTLAMLYLTKKQYHLAAGVQEWYLEIASHSKSVSNEKLIEETHSLIKLWLQLGRDSEAKDLLQVLVDMKLKG